MSLFGPIFSPATIVNNAVDNPERAVGQITANAVAQAVEAAINPSPEQRAEEERARQEQARENQKREEDRRTQEEQSRLLLDAQRQQQLLKAAELDPTGLIVANRASVLGKIGPGELDDGIAFDAEAVELEAQRQRVIQEMLKDPERKDTSLAVNIPGTEGLVPELPLAVLSGAGVIRLSLQEAPANTGDPAVDPQKFVRDDVVEERDDGKRIRVRLDFADGTHVNTELDFKPADDDRIEDGRVAGRIDRRAPSRAAA